MPSERTGRLFRLALVSWISMVGIVGVMAAVKWNQPGFRDPDITGPLEMALTFMIVSALPLAFIASLVLAPLTALIDSLVKGRLGFGWNTSIGAMLALPAAAAVVLVGLLLYGRLPNTNIATLSAGVPVFAVGGIIVSLGMRRRTSL